MGSCAHKTYGLPPSSPFSGEHCRSLRLGFVRSFTPFSFGVRTYPTDCYLGPLPVPWLPFTDCSCLHFNCCTLNTGFSGHSPHTCLTLGGCVLTNGVQAFLAERHYLRWHLYLQLRWALRFTQGFSVTWTLSASRLPLLWWWFVLDRTYNSAWGSCLCVGITNFMLNFNPTSDSNVGSFVGSSRLTVWTLWCQCLVWTSLPASPPSTLPCFPELGCQPVCMLGLRFLECLLADLHSVWGRTGSLRRTHSVYTLDRGSHLCLSFSCPGISLLALHALSIYLFTLLGAALLPCL